MQRKPSHLGSYSQAGPDAPSFGSRSAWSGTAGWALASIGRTGGITGRSIAPSCQPAGRSRPSTFGAARLAITSGVTRTAASIQKDDGPGALVLPRMPVCQVAETGVPRAGKRLVSGPE